MISDMVHDSSTPETMHSNSNLFEIGGTSVAATSQSGVSAVLAASTSISSRRFHSLDTTI